jgi:protein TonB
MTNTKCFLEKQLLIFFVTLFLFIPNTFAQDVITLKNGDEINVKVQEVGIDDVIYKANGQIYTKKQSEIFRIVYANGTIEVFKNTLPPPPPDQNSPTENKQLQTQDKQEEEEIYKFADEMPEFPGGAGELTAFINRNTVYPKKARENFIQGTTVIQFIIRKDGSVDKATILASSHRLLDEEAVRVVESLPKWIPAKINGKSVASYFTIPFSFTIQ